MITKIGKKAEEESSKKKKQKVTADWDKRKQGFDSLNINDLSLLQNYYPDLFKKEVKDLEGTKPDQLNWLPPLYGAGLGSLGAASGAGIAAYLSKSQSPEAMALGAALGGLAGGGLGSYAGNKLRETAFGPGMEQADRAKAELLNYLATH